MILSDWLELRMRTITVRLSKDFKKKYAKNELVKEFRNSTGRILGFMNWPNSGSKGPEVDVMWEEGLHYLYFPQDLEVVVIGKKSKYIPAAPPLKLPKLTGNAKKRAEAAEKAYRKFAAPKKK